MRGGIHTLVIVRSRVIDGSGQIQYSFFWHTELFLAHHVCRYNNYCDKISAYVEAIMLIIDFRRKEGKKTRETAGVFMKNMISVR